MFTANHLYVLTSCGTGHQSGNFRRVSAMIKMSDMMMATALTIIQYPSFQSKF